MAQMRRQKAETSEFNICITNSHFKWIFLRSIFVSFFPHQLFVGNLQQLLFAIIWSKGIHIRKTKWMKKIEKKKNKNNIQ